jgi:hypothetical protein
MSVIDFWYRVNRFIRGFFEKKQNKFCTPTTKWGIQLFFYTFFRSGMKKITDN